jgi:vacuolar-type H+-ATPase subunit E/Vma4
MKDIGPLPSDRARLIQSLWQDARREADQITAKAQAEAQKILEESNSFRKLEMGRSLERARLEAGPHVSRIINQARRRAMQTLLECRYSFLDSCYDEALKLSSGARSPGKETRSSLHDLLRPAMSALGDLQHVEIKLNPADMASARSILEEKGTPFDLAGDENISGGALVKGCGGDLVADNTIEARLSALKKLPPIELLKMINPGKSKRGASQPVPPHPGRNRE